MRTVLQTCRPRDEVICRNPVVARSFPACVPADLVPSKPITQVAGVIGGNRDAANGVDHGGVRTFTRWGEIAFQLGGKEGYVLLAEE